MGIGSRKVNFILDADIRAFFDTVSQEWLICFVEQRVGDKRIIRLIQKWLKAGVLEDGIVTVSDKGTGQGSVISPLLANIYLHYVLDLWAERWRRRHASGDIIIVRYADDLVVGFEHQADAAVLPGTICARGWRKNSLTLHPGKTRLIEFGRHAAQDRERAVSANRKRSASLASPSSAASRAGASSCLNGSLAPTGCAHASSGQGGAASADASDDP